MKGYATHVWYVCDDPKNSQMAKNYQLGTLNEINNVKVRGKGVATYNYNHMH